MTPFPIQTLTSNEGIAITISSSVGFLVVDVVTTQAILVVVGTLTIANTTTILTIEIDVVLRETLRTSAPPSIGMATHTTR